MIHRVRLTEHFYDDEFLCPCCGGGRTEITMQLVEALQVCRYELGEPILISSGYRCKDYNREIGGSEYSYHCLGGAADVQIKHLVMAKRRNLLTIVAQKFPGLGIYHKHLHCDLGPMRYWTGKSK